MISIQNKFKSCGLLFIAAIAVLSACNKEPEQFADSVPVAPSGISLGETIAANANDSLYYRLIVKAGMVPAITNKTTTLTMFVPDNNAMRLFISALSGGVIPPNAPDAVFSNFIQTTIPAATAAAIVSYNITPQALPSSKIPGTFPNFQYPSILNPAPALSALLRLTTFPSTRNGAWVNNIPIATADVTAVNGIIHQTAFLVTPPSKYLWERINTDVGLTYFKAAIIRADSGVAPTSATSLIGALNNIGANLTVFAPTDAAMQAALTGAIYQGVLPLVTQQLTAAYIGAGLTAAQAAAKAAIDAPPIALTQATALASTPAVFQNTALFGVLTAQTVKGLVVYHILGSRAFTNNFPTTATAYPTLLNGAIPVHPGVTLQATFGAPFVTAATVKGAINPTASNIIINALPLLPEPFGTSDQHYLNGVLHKIDQVLIPLPL